MKPIKLEMQAFGTFAKKTVIDFSNLNDRVFLIYGKTGSGKTTIFDAICYALYGEVTGDLRNKEVTDNVRSSYSDNQTPTYVIFEFQIKANIYKITRFPGKQQIEKRLTHFKNERVEVLKNGENITKAKVNETNDMIEEDIIKLTRSQFKQTMMISQGDFAALIKSDSKERTAIFRNILDTANLNDIAQLVKEDTLELEKKSRSYKTALVSQINGLSNRLFSEEYYKTIVSTEGCYTLVDEIEAKALDTLEANNKQVDELKNKANELDKAIELMAGHLATITANNKSVDDYKKNLQKKEELDSKKIQIDILKSKIDYSKKAEAINNKLTIFNSANKRYEENEKTITDYNKRLTDLLANQKEIDNNYNLILSLEQKSKELSNRLNEIEGILKAIKLLDDINKSIVTLEENKAKVFNECKACEQALDNATKKHAEASKYILDNADIESKIAEQNRLMLECQTKQSKINALGTRVANINNESQKLEQAQNDLAKLKKKYDLAKADALIIEGNFIKNQAGYIAKSLKDGTPCPVCGSVHHPNICKEYDEAYSKDKVDQAKILADNAKSDYDKKNIEVARLAQGIEGSQNQALAEITELLGYSVEYNDALGLLRQEWKACSQLYEELKTGLIDLNKALEVFKENKRIADDNAILENLTKKLEHKKFDLDTITTELASKNGEAKQLQEQIANQNSVALQNEKIQAEANIAGLNKKVEAFRNAKNSFDSKKTSYQGIIDQASSKRDSYKKDMNDTLEDLTYLENKYGISRTDISNLLLDEAIGEEYNTQVKEYENSLISVNALIKEAINNGVDKLQIESTAEIEKQLFTTKTERTKLNEQIADFNELFNMMKRQLTNINKAKEEYLLRSKEYIPLKELDEVINGEVSKKRITFETYYQVQFFKQILRIASKRFEKMTGGNYSLAYKEELEGGSKKTGLDMEVIDNYNGIRRAVGTLSGGESFMASLALALSMSDIIQAKAGGISLDSMFIDEGFGTLDPEALNNAIDQIAALSCNGKTVGLISHVEELKNRISTQIHVIKKENGSIIE